MRQKMAMITLGVADMDRSVSFYERGLGWKRSPASTKNLIVYSLGGIAIALYPRKMLAEDATVDEVGSGFSGVTISHNTKNEVEVDSVLAEAVKAGATLVKPAQKVFWVDTAAILKTQMGT